MQVRIRPSLSLMEMEIKPTILHSSLKYCILKLPETNVRLTIKPTFLYVTLCSGNYYCYHEPPTAVRSIELFK